MKKKVLGILLSGVLAAASLGPMSMTALADSEKVVTLGADLDENQKNAVLRYFGILGQNVRTLTITNQDERNHLASYVPIEQIGTRTFSCALVNPTTSGGIRVKTANLTWVTGNMIASTLSTSGVTNCEVLAAAPFEVSGTGALTGVIMAYESASGTVLDSTRKDIATQELVTTTTLANAVGQTDATNIVNEIKIQVIEGEVVDPVEVEEIVDEVITSEATSALTAQDRALLNDLANRIAQQKYDYDEMKETLERVEQNVNVSVNVEQPPINITVSNDANNSSNNTNTNTNDTSNVSTNTNDNTSSADSASSSVSENTNENTNENTAESASDSDSILNSVDENAFGYDVVTSTTDEPAEEVQEALGINPAQAEAPQAPQEQDPFEITSSEDYSDNPEAAPQPEVSEGTWDNPEQGQIAEQPATVENPDAWTQEPAPEPYVENPEVQPEAQPEAAPEENPEAQPEAAPEENPEAQPEPEMPQEEAPAQAAELTLDDNTVRILPAQGSNAAGAGVLRIRVAAKGVAPVAGDDGSFGKIVVSGPLAYDEVILQDAFDPSAYDSAVVAVQNTSDADLAALGWTEGTDICIDLGTAFAFGDDPANQYTIDIQNLALRQTAEDGTVIANGVLNKTVGVYVDQVGLVFNISNISEMKAGNTVNGYIVMPADPEDGSFVYTTYIDCPAGIAFTLGEDGRSFTAQLLQAGDAAVTVNVSMDGMNYVPYALTIPVLQ